MFPVEAPANVTPLSIKKTKDGVHFSILAPDAETVHLTGSFNGGADMNGYSETLDDQFLMYGPYEDGYFEYFYPVSPGQHAYSFVLDRELRIYGDPSLPKAKDFYNYDQDIGRYELKGSLFEFSISQPPWPSYVDNKHMTPTIIYHPDTFQPYLRVRYFSKHANSIHCVGNWDGWAGAVDRIDNKYHRTLPTKVPNIYEYYIPISDAGSVEYKFVLDTYSWVPDPSVVDTNAYGNTVVEIHFEEGKPIAEFTPRFNPHNAREKMINQFGNDLIWHEDKMLGINEAKKKTKPVIWVITIPGSQYSSQLMKDINSDEKLVELLHQFVCIETPAYLVHDVLVDQKIKKLPCVVLLDKTLKPVWNKSSPTVTEILEEAIEL